MSDSTSTPELTSSLITTLITTPGSSIATLITIPSSSTTIVTTRNPTQTSTTTLQRGTFTTPGSTPSTVQANPSFQEDTSTYLSICAVNGTAEPCATATAYSPVSTVFIVDPINVTSQLPGTTIVGIVVAAVAFLIAVGTGLWLYRRKAASRPQRVLPYIHERDGKPGDRSSIISGRSAGSMRSARSARSMLSLWSTFSNRQQNLNVERTSSVEDGVRVEIDTVQVVEEPYSPMTVPPTGVSLFTPRRTTRQWTGYGVSGNRLANDKSDIFNPSTIISSSSIPEEETEVEFPTHLIAKPGLDPSPFSDVYDVKASPVDTQDTSSGTEPSEHDAAQLSQRDLEALADIVAARLNRRVDFSPASEYTHATPNATDLPPRYF